MRSFDPLRVGRLECDAWVAYYRRRWPRFFAAAIALTRETFGLSWPQTIRGAWLVLRANQLWVPKAGNDPDGARDCMRRFYALVAVRHGESFDTSEAARLEVEWWRLHRELQDPARRGEEGELDSRELELSGAIAALFSHVYGVRPETVREAAVHRALAMRHSDRWVAEGSDPASPLIPLERGQLIDSYVSLKDGVAP